MTAENVKKETKTQNLTTKNYGDILKWKSARKFPSQRKWECTVNTPALKEIAN
jgi:hypothetical protein